MSMSEFKVRQAVRGVPRQRRITRSPKHAFHVVHRPFQIQPFMLHPVLPGETLNEGLLQAKCKTDALDSDVDLIGWWLEFYVFYVKLSDLDGFDDFTEMLLQDGYDLSAYDDAANAVFYHAGPGINWTEQCYDCVAKHWFRPEDEPAHKIGGRHVARVDQETIFDSAILDSAVEATDVLLPGEDDVVPDHLTAQSDRYTAWEKARSLELTNATYRDWCAAFGIEVKEEEPERIANRPELVRYMRDWQYPSTAVDGASGSTTSAVIWSVADQIKKRRLFKEPGFLIGVVVAKPKAYFGNQTGQAAHLFNDAFSWMPAAAREHAFTSMRKYAVATPDGPLGATPSGEYWLDLRDLLVYGDQFTNLDLTGATPPGFVDLPASDLNRKFVSDDDMNRFFANSVVGNEAKTDGVLSLKILGTQKDHTN